MKMAGPKELDFALASFWEFVKIWKSGNKCKFLLTCDGGQGRVELVAELGAAEDLHFLAPPLPYNGRKKTPSQLRREERRRNQRTAEEAECDAVRTVEKIAGAVVAEKATEVQQSKMTVLANETVLETDDTKLVDEVCTNEQFDHAVMASDLKADKVIFSFKSDYAEKDIIDTLNEVFVDTVTKANLVSRERTSPRSAEHLCFVELEQAAEPHGKEFLWPDMGLEDAVIFQELKRVKK